MDPEPPHVHIDRNRILQYTKIRILQECHNKIQLGIANPSNAPEMHVDIKTVEMCLMFDAYVTELELFLTQLDVFTFLYSKREDDLTDDDNKLISEFRTKASYVYATAMFTVFLCFRGLVDEKHKYFDPKDIPRLYAEVVEKHCTMFIEKDIELKNLVLYDKQILTDEMNEVQDEFEDKELRAMVEHVSNRTVYIHDNHLVYEPQNEKVFTR